MSTNDDYHDPDQEFPDDRTSSQRHPTAPEISNRRYDSWLSLEVYVKANNPELLVGLDQWLQLGLVSQGQVRKLCRNHLSCALPDVVEVVENIAIENSIVAEVTEKSLVTAASSPNILSRVWQGFLDELSIRWLLFLGIFLVVISSGVLAASQWQNFPVLGQYLVLLVYTLSFWGIGWWTGKQDNLKLTSQTLSWIATLLVPINFWAISHLGLGSKLIGFFVIALAVVVLTAIVFSLQGNKEGRNNLWLIIFLYLSYLHLGWQVPWLSLIAVYGGITIISLFSYWLMQTGKKYSIVNLLLVLATWSLLLARILIGNLDLTRNYSMAIAILGWLLATIYLTQIKQNKQALNQELNQQSSAEVANIFFGKICQVVSIILFTVTWLLSVKSGILESSLFFWQTIGISGLAIHLFSQRLTLYWRKRDLTAIFFLGLQTLYISKEIIPDSLRTQALDLSVVVSKTDYFPESVLGVTLFPYVVVFIWIASWLYQRQKSELALYSEYLTLFLGISLTCVSFVNPTWRSLNLLLSTCTLVYVAQIRQPLRVSLIYFAHLLGLITIINGINFALPNLTKPWWGMIFSFLMVIEWATQIRQLKSRRTTSTTNFTDILWQSCWYFGLLLSAVSYSCFLSYIDTSSLSANSFRWGLIWLTTPGMLTLIAKYTRRIQQRRLATILSCITLLGVQLLVYGKPETRLIGLAVATGLMYVNAFNLRRTLVTVIHLGFALSLLVSLVSSLIDLNLINIWDWLLLGSATILGLYQLRLYLLKTINTPKFNYISQRTAHGILGAGVEAKNFKLLNKYIQATDYWAIALIVFELVIISIIYLYHLCLPEVQISGQYFSYLLTTGLLTGALLWRYSLQLNNLVLYTLVWLAELFVFGLVMLFAPSNLIFATIFATINIILGLVALKLVGCLKQLDSSEAKLNVFYVPLVYAVCGILWRLSYFNAFTGLLTLGAALILINTQQRNIQSNPQISTTLNYLGFAAISGGIYELVIYQMQTSTGGSIADGLTILALVAAAIAFSYRLTTWWYRQRNQLTLFNLELDSVVLIAHLHWVISSILKIIAAGIAIESSTPRLTSLSIATSFFLGIYAVIQGKEREINTDKNNNKTSNDWWVYVGLVEIAATLIYSRLIITRLSLFDPWRIVFTCAVALLIYQIPWQNFGWRATPWQRTALIIPALMTLVIAEDISYLSLVVTTLFYVRIAYIQQNIRWSYISLGFCNWLIIRLVWQHYPEFIWVAAIISLSILYIAQFDPYYQNHRSQRHYLRLIGSSIICTFALFEQPGIIPGAISFSLIFLGLGLQIRAFLFSGTITLILTVIYQLVILIVTYSFLKWIVGLLAGICSIAIAAGFEKQRTKALKQLKNYNRQLQNWQ